MPDLSSNLIQQDIKPKLGLKYKVLIAVILIAMVVFLYYYVYHYQQKENMDDDEMADTDDDWDLENAIRKLNEKQDKIIKTLSV
jgi:uncharacterized membrane protein